MISRNTGNNGNKCITIKNENIEKVNKFKYLGAYVTSKNEVTEEIKSSLVSGKACFHSVQKLLTLRLISRKLKLKKYRTVILSVILYDCESLSTRLADEHKGVLRIRAVFCPSTDFNEILHVITRPYESSNNPNPMSISLSVIMECASKNYHFRILIFIVLFKINSVISRMAGATKSKFRLESTNMMKTL